MYWYKNLHDKPTYDDLRYRSSASAKISRTFVEFLILVFLLICAFVLFSGINYVDVNNNCFIRVKYDVLSGNRDTIVQALEELKYEDFIFYRRFCANVNTIHEKKCIRASNEKYEIEFRNSEGCYIKGAHSIVIRPIESDGPNAVKTRKESIIKYGDMAIDYWNSIETQP